MSNITMPSGYMDMSAAELEYDGGKFTLADLGGILLCVGIACLFATAFSFRDVGFGTLEATLGTKIFGSCAGVGIVSGVTLVGIFGPEDGDA